MGTPRGSSGPSLSLLPLGDSVGPRERGGAGSGGWRSAPAALPRPPAGSAPPWSRVCPPPAASTAPASSSCGTPTSSCARARPTLAARTPACGSSSASTSRSLTAARSRCRSPRTPSSAVSAPARPAARVRGRALPRLAPPSCSSVCRLRAVLPVTHTSLCSHGHSAFLWAQPRATPLPGTRSRQRSHVIQMLRPRAGPLCSRRGLVAAAWGPLPLVMTLLIFVSKLSHRGSSVWLVKPWDPREG